MTEVMGQGVSLVTGDYSRGAAGFQVENGEITHAIEEVIAMGVAGSSVELLEGNWPHEGALQLYKCPSMDALLTFWNSPEYQEAIKLREGVVETNFTVAIESTE